MTRDELETRIETLENAVCSLADAVLALCDICDIQENPANYPSGSKWMKAHRHAKAVQNTFSDADDREE